MATKEMQQPSAPHPRNLFPKGASFKKPWDDMVKFLRGVKIEFNKVTWPTRQELRYNSTVVIVATVLISIYMWGADKLFSLVFHLFGRG